MSAFPAEVEGVTPERFETEIVPAHVPVVMRGLVAAWPAVRAGRAGPASTGQYLKRFGGQNPLAAMVGPPSIGGRFFYSDDLRGFNFDRVEVAAGVLIDELLKMAAHPAPPAVYAGSLSAAQAFAGFARDNPAPLPVPLAESRLWIGNTSRVAAHYDLSNNLAVVVSGRRRFHLFAPEQAANLYIGPLDHTIAGQPTSMVDLAAPDLARYPRFAAAQAHGLSAQLEPGDAIYIPRLWWHGVEAVGPLNVLVNYWFGEQPALSPFTALIHALVAVRDLPAPERAAVKDWFDRYVFDEDASRAADHLPAYARGVLGPPGEARGEHARRFLLAALSGRT